MRWTRAKKILVALFVIFIVAIGIAWFLNREDPLDLRFTGAYELDDGQVVAIGPRIGPTLRMRIVETGETRALFPVDGKGGLRFEAGPGWAEREPVEVEMAFQTDSAGDPESFTWIKDGVEQTAPRLDLREELFSFSSGELTLRAKLVLPEGPGPHPVVVLVHGSGADSAVDSYWMPYQFAPNGIATLVYDKRGTGESEGKYLQNFHVLAGDTVAAVEALRTRPEIDPDNIHLAGYSQGGWIAPLAASQTEGIRSLLINYGPMVTVADEDRWGYTYALQQKGFDGAAIREADKLNDLLSRAIEGDTTAWAEFGPMREKVKEEAWYQAAAGSDSMIGFIADMPLPVWALRMYGSWRLRPIDGVAYIERLYDPVPTLAGLDIPSLWIFGGEDSSMPTQWSIDELVTLQDEGRPIDLLIYPNADHGITTFEETESEGRRLIGYEPTYVLKQIEWLRLRSGLDEAPNLIAEDELE